MTAHRTPVDTADVENLLRLLAKAGGLRPLTPVPNEGRVGRRGPVVPRVIEGGGGRG